MKATGENTFISVNTLEGKKNTQYVFKQTYAIYEIFLKTSDELDDWAVVDYSIRLFDENFNELNVVFEGDSDSPTEVMSYLTIVDVSRNDISNDYNGHEVYYMVTLKNVGLDFNFYV